MSLNPFLVDLHMIPEEILTPLVATFKEKCRVSTRRAENWIRGWFSKALAQDRELFISDKNFRDTVLREEIQKYLDDPGNMTGSDSNEESDDGGAGRERDTGVVGECLL